MFGFIANVHNLKTKNMFPKLTLFVKVLDNLPNNTKYSSLLNVINTIYIKNFKLQSELLTEEIDSEKKITAKNFN